MSCLFNSLSHFLKINSSTIRSKVCDYLEKNGKIIEGIETKDLLAISDLDHPMTSEKYIQQMRKTSTWGGAIEIQSACNIWKIRILVINKSNLQKCSIIEFIPVTGQYISTVVIEWTGGHFEPVDNFTKS